MLEHDAPNGRQYRFPMVQENVPQPKPAPAEPPDRRRAPAQRHLAPASMAPRAAADDD